METYIDIKDYEGLYQVSNTGYVRSLGCGKTHKTIKILKSAKNTWGYLFVRLTKNGQTKNKTIHRLVAEAFLPNSLNLPQVNHKDEDKTNNFVFLNEDGSVDKEKSNLEWCDNKYNVNYGTRNSRAGKKLTNGKKSKPILQYTLNGEFIREWPSAPEIKRQLGFLSSHIGECCRGNTRLKTYKGYIWKYKETL